MKRAKKTDRKIKVNELLFYLLYAEFIIGSMLNNVTGFSEIFGTIHKVVLLFALFACLISISRMPKRKMLILYLITMLVVITRFTSGKSTVVTLWVLVILSRGISLDRVIKYDLKLRIPLLITVSILYFLGMTAVNVHFRDGIIRHSMGFGNPNIFSAHVMAIVAEVIYLRRYKTSFLFDLIVGTVGICLVAHFTDSRTQMICMAIIVIGVMLRKLFRHKNSESGLLKRGLMFVMNNSFFILLGISLLFVYAFSSGNPVALELNEYTSGRLSNSSEVLSSYNVTLLGQDLQKIDSDYADTEKVSMDNSYIYFLLTFGVIPTIFFGYSLYKYFKKASIDNRFVYFVMFVFMLGGLMERYCFEPLLNVFILYFSSVLFFYPGRKVNGSDLRIGESSEL